MSSSLMLDTMARSSGYLDWATQPDPFRGKSMSNVAEDLALAQDLADIAAYYAAQAHSGGQTDPELLALGEKVYRNGVAERNVAACSACHSPTGSGNAPAGFPALGGQHAEYTALQLRAYRKGYEDASGRTNDGDAKIMRTTAFGLSDGEIDAVSSYIAGLK